VAFPAWVAVIEHAPTATIVTVVPETVHTGIVFEANVTASPELALAEIGNAAAPNATLPRALNVIVCVP
jgi:hypothetical protein